MIMKRLAVLPAQTCFGLILLTCWITPGFAYKSQGLLGKDYIQASVSRTSFEEDSIITDSDDDLLGVRATINKRVLDNFDIFATYYRASVVGNNDDGIEVERVFREYLFGYNYYVKPSKKARANFTLGIGRAFNDTDLDVVGQNGEEGDEQSFIMGLNLEYDVLEQSSFRPFLRYNTAGNDSTGVMGVDFSTWWFNRSVFTNASVDYDVSDDELTILIGAGLAF